MSKQKNGERLPTEYQNFIHLSRYSRWDWALERRETWVETVERYMNYFDGRLKERFNYSIPLEDFKRLRASILSLAIMPSMRCMMTAGPALDKENIAGYNCSYIHVDKPTSFDEILYVLMNGTGVGFSVEERYTAKLPVVPPKMYKTDSIIKVHDSKLGWAKAFRELIALLYSGLEPSWDLSEIRPAGSILRTFGGRASGPAPLDNLFKFTVQVFKSAGDRRLRPIECHDIVCKTAEVVVVGGVRRSALISLSDLGDSQMRGAKSGNWWDRNGQRALANNSANYHEIPDMGTFMSEWMSLYDSKSGERGIFSSKAAESHVERRLEGRRVPLDDFGTNPCCEIILRSRELCNLSEVVVRRGDSVEDINEKVRLATILGTMQSTLTEFRYVNEQWKENCEEERLLGVSMTGIMDNVFTSTPSEELANALMCWRTTAQKTNNEVATAIGIKPSAAITCVKPSGTVSQLVDSSSGIHGRHAPFYIRTVRMDAKDPMTQFMKDSGFPWEPDVTRPDHTCVFPFPQRSPRGSTMRDSLTAVEQMEVWMMYQEHWCEHKASVTVSVHEHEWMEVGAWVYENFDSVSGISFLPYNEHVYEQAPYQDCTEEEWKELNEQMPVVKWDDLSKWEHEDYTTASQELSCHGNSCEI